MIYDRDNEGRFLPLQKPPKQLTDKEKMMIENFKKKENKMKYILVVYSHTDKSYKRVIGEPTENYKKLLKAKIGLEINMSDKFFTKIDEAE